MMECVGEVRNICFSVKRSSFLLGVGYTGVKNHFFVILFLQQFFCIPFTLSQHEMTKFLAWGPRKKCAGPKSKMAAVFPQKSHFQP